MAPAGVSENIAKLVAPPRSAQDIAEHILPFVKSYSERIMSVDELGEPETGRVSGILVLERAKKSVPNDQCAPMVAVDIFAIASMVNTVVSRAIKYQFKTANRTDQACVKPELVQQTDGTNGHDYGWGKADDGHPKPENEAHEASRPSLAERGGQVIALR